MLSLEERVLNFGVTQPDKLAVGTKAESVSYGQLRETIMRMSSFLHDQGVKRDDIVMLQATASTDYIAAYLTVHCLGAYAVPLDWKATEETVRTIKERLGATALLGTAKFVEKMNMSGFSYDQMKACQNMLLLHDQYESEDNIYDILFTTGTTGASKGVVSTRKSIAAAIANEIEGASLSSDEVLLIPIPLNHSFGIGKMRAVLWLGASVVVQNTIGLAAEIKNNIQRFGCTAMICVPSALQVLERLVGDRINEILGGLHFIEAASAPFEIGLKKKMISSLPGVHVLNRYGSTETPAAIYLDMLERPDKLASIGKPVSAVKVKTVDDSFRQIESTPDKPGRLAISGPMIMNGYFNDSALTATVLKNGWMYTRDLAYIDDEGYVYLVGREDDVINTGGKKVAPSEVEEIALKSGLVLDCAVVGIPDPAGLLGSVPAMMYVPDNGTAESDVMAYLRSCLEMYKLPVRTKSVSALPRNYMGKIDRRKIIEMFSDHTC